METKHTKGEWHLYRTEHELYVTCENNRQSICKLPVLYPHSNANARLISAAPDLLDALLVLLDSSNAPEWKKELAIKAINKATK